MKKPGFALKIAVVTNALLLVIAFIGCRAGGLDSSDAEPVSQQAKPYFMSGSKSLLTGSFAPPDQSPAAKANPASNDQSSPQPSNASKILPKSEGAQP